MPDYVLDFSESDFDKKDDDRKTEGTGRGSRKPLILAVVAVLAVLAIFLFTHFHVPHEPIKHIPGEHPFKVTGTPLREVPSSAVLARVDALEKPFLSTGSYITYLYPSTGDYVPVVKTRVSVVYSADPGIAKKYNIMTLPPDWLKPPEVSTVTEVVYTPQGMVYLGPLTAPAVLRNAPVDTLLRTTGSVIVIYDRNGEANAYALQCYYLLTGKLVAIYPVNSQIGQTVLKALSLPKGNYLLVVRGNTVVAYGNISKFAAEAENYLGRTFTPDTATLYVATGCSPCEQAEQALQGFPVKVVDVTKTPVSVDFVPALKLKLWFGKKYINETLQGKSEIISSGPVLLEAFGFE